MSEIVETLTTKELDLVQAPMPFPLNPRYRSLDLWRGLACLMIVVYHSSYYLLQDKTIYEGTTRPVAVFLLNLAAGVPIFFVISGYCIAATCDSSRRKPDPLREFFLRRFRRIFPPYWAALLFGIVFIGGIAWAGFPNIFDDDKVPMPLPEMLTPWQWFGTVSLTETWRHHLVGNQERFFLSHAWTLAYEEQFYAVCAILLLFWPSRFFFATAVVTLLTLALAPLPLVVPGLDFEGFFFDGHWFLFAAGVFLYYHLNYKSRSRISPFFPIVASVLVGAVAVFKLGYGGNSPLAMRLIFGMTFALVAAAWHRWDLAIANCPLLRPLAFCGVMCYSLYLVHWPIVKAVSHALFLAGVEGFLPTLAITFPLAIGSSVLAGWVFYSFVEKRWLNPRMVMAISSISQVSLPLPTATTARSEVPPNHDQFVNRV